VGSDNSRPKRLAEQIKRLISDLIRREVKDPRVGLVTVTHVDVSRDMSHAKIYVLPFDAKTDSKDWLRALQSAAGFLRIQLKKALAIRHVPELKFVEDESIERALHLSSLIDNARRRDDALAQAAQTSAEPSTDGERLLDSEPPAKA